MEEQEFDLSIKFGIELVFFSVDMWDGGCGFWLGTEIRVEIYLIQEFLK